VSKKAEYQLTMPERRQLLALARDRDRVMAEANAELEEIGAGIDDLAARLAGAAGLPTPGEGQRLAFEDAPDGGIVLRIVGNSAEPGGEG